MKKTMSTGNYFTGTVDKFAKVWNFVTGKTYKKLLEDKQNLEEKISGLEIDIEALKIKLASTEIDLKASEIEKETIKMQLEEKKMLLVDLRLKLNQLESTTVTSDIELNQILRSLKLKEEENENLKQKMLLIMNMLCAMSENEKYQDIVKIQTNTIDEVGTINHSLYVSYNGQTVEMHTQDVMQNENTYAQNKQDNIIRFNPQAIFETEDDLVEMAE